MNDMSDQPGHPASDEGQSVDESAIQHGVLVDGSGMVLIPAGAQIEQQELTETVTAPAKVMRIGSMVKQLLEEVKSAELDEASRERLGEIYERSIVELSGALSEDLQQELRMLTLPFRDGETPTMGELRIAQAQLVGWLEGLFHGIQATLFAQQIAARQQLEQMRGIPPGAQGGDPRLTGQPGQSVPPSNVNDRPGTYL